MGMMELFLTAVALSMDAVAVSMCKGLAMGKMNWRKALVIGLYFGVFQGLMPLAGYLLGVNFRDMIAAVDHWVAFALLLLIGGNMIRESYAEDCECASSSVNVREMLVLAVATSIDALAVGVNFAFLSVSIVPAVAFIAVITFALSTFGVKVGNLFGTRFKAKAERTGGVILVLIGLKILVEHLLG